ncbi:hypothetical protein RZS08_57000, partial [Arthrospira platensis SPKY1]|nr:hypothetical protein [Arthrospira platensis SPKY1]
AKTANSMAIGGALRSKYLRQALAWTFMRHPCRCIHATTQRRTGTIQEPVPRQSTRRGSGTANFRFKTCRFKLLSCCVL